MNKKITYVLLISLFLAGIAFIFARYKIKEANGELSYSELLDRKGELAETPEWKRTRTKAWKLIRSVAKNSGDTKSELELAAIYIREARISGNYSYYDLAALKQTNKVLSRDPNNFMALTYKALVYLSQHHFAEGLELAAKANEINPHNALVYGMLVDGNVEMGNYDKAVANSDKMVALRPDLSSYSRISYLREIFGDYPGAIEAMKMAVEAGLPGEDNTEWTRVQLGHLYENTGKMDSAGITYAQSLFYRKGYAPAIAGLGHVAMMRRDYETAIKYYEQADDLMVDYSVKENLATLYKITGNKKKSDDISSSVIDAMNRDATSADKNENIGHYVDRELANAYLQQGNMEDALKHALIEYNRRPENIDVNQTVAWVYYKMGNFVKAKKYIDTALKTNCKNPILLAQAGLIYSKAGTTAAGKKYLSDALKNDPGIDLEVKKESSEMLEQL